MSPPSPVIEAGLPASTYLTVQQMPGRAERYSNPCDQKLILSALWQAGEL